MKKNNENNRSLCVLCFNYHSDFWTQRFVIDTESGENVTENKKKGEKND